MPAQEYPVLPGTRLAEGYTAPYSRTTGFRRHQAVALGRREQPGVRRELRQERPRVWRPGQTAHARDKARDAADDRLPCLVQLAQIDASIVQSQENGRLVEQARRAVVELRRRLVRQDARLLGVSAAPLGLGPEPARDRLDVEHLRRAVALRRRFQQRPRVVFSSRGAK